MAIGATEVRMLSSFEVRGRDAESLAGNEGELAGSSWAEHEKGVMNELMKK